VQVVEAEIARSNGAKQRWEVMGLEHEKINSIADRPAGVVDCSSVKLEEVDVEYSPPCSSQSAAATSPQCRSDSICIMPLDGDEGPVRFNAMFVAWPLDCTLPTRGPRGSVPPPVAELIYAKHLIAFDAVAALTKWQSWLPTRNDSDLAPVQCNRHRHRRSFLPFFLGMRC